MAYEIKYDSNGTSSHGRVLKAILERVRLSETKMSDHFDRYREMEKKYLLYKKKPEDKLGTAVKKANQDQYEAVTIPATYSQLLTAHTYWTNVFLNQPVTFQMSGTDGQGVKKEQAMESMLQYQVTKGKMMPALMVWLLDVGRYGVGIIGNYWAEDFTMQTDLVDVEEEEDGVATGNVVQRLRRRRYTNYEGNKVYNVLPYDALPDPRVALIKLQEGEFFGRKVTMSWNDIKRGQSAGDYFNIDELERMAHEATRKDQRFSAQTNDEQPDPSGRLQNGGRSQSSSSFVDVIEMHIDLIPREWDLGDSDFPEKWVFTVANKRVIIGATPSGMIHNKFPFHVLEYEVDGYKQQSRGVLEVGQDLNNVLDWLFNSHMFNKRAVLNNQFVYDPSRVVERDLQRREPGKLIRLKPTAYGTDVRTAISQLPVSDVTTQNFQDANIVEGQLQRDHWH